MKAQNAKFFSIVTLFILTVFSGALVAQQVKTDYDHHANFGQYRTYSWEKVQTRDPLLVDRIKDAVNRALTAKGWTPVDSGGDVCIVAMDIREINRRSTLSTMVLEEVGAGEDSVGSVMRQQQLKPIRLGLSSSICSTPRARI